MPRPSKKQGKSPNQQELFQTPRGLSQFLDPESLKLLTGSGLDLFQQIGAEVIREIILDILTGKNLRDSTEILTRTRVTSLNLATLSLFLKGAATEENFIDKLALQAARSLTRKGLSKEDRWLAQWVLGLTDKSVQNVLRDNKKLLDSYKERYMQVCQEVSEKHRAIYGDIQGKIHLGNGLEAPINWLFMAYLMNTIGAQTLAIRGSEKSSIGKLFEKLVLGSLLSILGFRLESNNHLQEGTFWLSTRENKRESDATLLYEMGKGARFDIGFIGRGNTEISLDKVSRFSRYEEVQNVRFFMATIIIVDRIGSDSRIIKMAEEIDGRIVQMSAAYWPKEVASILHTKLGFRHELVNMQDSLIEDYLRMKLKQVPIEEFIRALPAENVLEPEEVSIENLKASIEDEIFD